VLSRLISESADPLFTVAIQQSAGLIWAIAILLVRSPLGSLEQLAAFPWFSLATAAVSGLLYASVYWLYMSAAGLFTAHATRCEIGHGSWSTA
jgi:hypothetical protein